MALAQQIYGGLYILSQFLTMALYAASSDLPNYLILVLPLSKRLHSIYVLRMFNDCWAIPTVLSAILLISRGNVSAGSILFRYFILRHDHCFNSILLYSSALLFLLR